MDVCCNDIIIESKDQQVISLLDKFFYNYRGKYICNAFAELFNQDKIQEFSRRGYYDPRDLISDVENFSIKDDVFFFRINTETAYHDNIEEIMVIVKTIAKDIPVNVFYCSEPDPAECICSVNNDLEGKYFDFRFEIEIRDYDDNILNLESFEKKEDLIRYVEKIYIKDLIPEDIGIEEIEKMIMDLSELEDGYVNIKQFKTGLKADCSEVIL